MNPIKKTLLSGKTNPGNKRQQSYINVSVLLGFVMLFFWTSLFRKTFIDVKIVLVLIIVPGLLATFFLFRKYVSICGYSHFLVGKTSYNFLLRILVFLLIAMPVGNLTAITFLYANQALADKNVQVVAIAPENSHEGSRKGKKYTAFNVLYGGNTKNIRSYGKSLTEIQNSQLKFSMRSGFFGYAFYDRYTFEPTQGKW